jgi:hypothetical protein
MTLFLAVFLFFSAQNTGNNLLFLMSSCFIAAIAFFSWIAYANLSGIALNVEISEAPIAGDEIVVKCYLKEMRDTDHFSLAFERDFCNILPAGDSIMLKATVKCSARGIYQLKEFQVFSFYPFSLCLVSMLVPEQEIFVGPFPAANIPELIDQEIGGAIQKYQAGKEGEYWMQKHYEPGEDASLINWTISARSNEEWVLTRAINFGLPEKLFFDFSGLEGQLFEDCLSIVMGVIYRMKNAGSSAFVWGQQRNRQYGWLTVSDNYSDLVRWLAEIESAKQIPPPAGEFRGIRFAEFMKEAL